MPTIEQQLNQLKKDKQTLVDNLVEKGVEATNEETFTTLVPKVKDITGESSKYAPQYISFYGCPLADLSEELEKLDLSNIEDATRMFSTTQLQKIDLSVLDWNKLEKIDYLCSDNLLVQEINFPIVNNDKIHSIQGIIGCCPNINENNCNFHNLHLNKVSDFTAAFQSTDFTEIDLSNMKVYLPTEEEIASGEFRPLDFTMTFNEMLHLKKIKIPSIDLTICDENYFPIMFTCTFMHDFNLAEIDFSGLVNNPNAMYPIEFPQCFTNCCSLQKLDIRGLDFSGPSGSMIMIDPMIFEGQERYPENPEGKGVPKDCQIIVKDEIAKAHFAEYYPDMTNVVTVAELGEE